MSSHLGQLSRDAGIPVIDGVEFACRIALALAASSLQTSKIGAYAAPRVKSALAASA
jgi:allantoin racemase